MPDNGPYDKQAYEDMREHQLAVEHVRRARNEAAGVLSLQAELAEAERALELMRGGMESRYFNRGLR